MKERLRADINVTPLVDVCLVLLIIFMVVTPMIVERVELPRTAQPDERKPKRSEQIRLVVGYPRAELWLEDQIVEESVLVDTLKEIKARSPGKARPSRGFPPRRRGREACDSSFGPGGIPRVRVRGAENGALTHRPR